MHLRLAHHPGFWFCLNGCSYKIVLKLTCRFASESQNTSTSYFMGNAEGRPDQETVNRFLNSINEHGASESLPTPMRTGDRVLLHSLGRADLNGRYALVLNPSPIHGRFHVRLEDNMSEVKVKRANMTKIRTVPQEVFNVEEEDEPIDTTSLIKGDTSRHPPIFHIRGGSCMSSPPATL